MVKPYNIRLQSQGHVKMTYRCSKCNAYWLLSCREHATPLPTLSDLASRSRSSKQAWGIYFVFYFIHLIIPFGKFGLPYLDKDTAAARAALASPTSACWVFSCFRNPPNSDMNYRIVNVRTLSFLCVPIHSGVEHTDKESAHTGVYILTRKNYHKFFLCSWWGSYLGSLDLESDALPVSHPRHP